MGFWCSQAPLSFPRTGMVLSIMSLMIGVTKDEETGETNTGLRLLLRQGEGRKRSPREMGESEMYKGQVGYRC